MAMQEVELPKGRLGVYFSGCPPRIDGIHQDSPLRGVVFPGQYAHSLIFPGVLEVSEFHGTKAFVQLLSQYDDHQRRVLILTDDPPVLTGSVNYKLYLPSGTIGMALDDLYPPVVSKVDSDSPVANIIRVGMTLERAYIPGIPMLEGNTTSHMAFAESLMNHNSQTGRILWLSEKAEIPAPSSLNLTYGVSSPVMSPVASPTHAPTSPPATAEGSQQQRESEPHRPEPLPQLVPFQDSGASAYKIQGQVSQSLTMDLTMGQSVLADPRSLIFMTEGIDVAEPSAGTSRWSDLTPQTTLASFKCVDWSGGSLCLAPPEGIGSILSISLREHGGALTCQRGSFLCSDDNVRIGVEFASKSFAFSGEAGFILQGVAGNGVVYLVIKGSVISRALRVGEILRVRTVALVAFENGVKHKADPTDDNGTIDTSTMMGPGTVWLQSAPSA